MHKQKSIFPVALTILFCLLGYLFVEVSAAEPEKESERLIAASKSELFHAAKKILVLQGFNLLKADEKSGVISTEPSPMRLVVDECECGTSMGPAEDTRPIIHVSISIRVAENSVAIRAEIHGDYPENQVTEEMIETDLLDQISRYME